MLAVAIFGVSAPIRAQGPAVDATHSYTPPGGFVPDARTAVRIAEAVLMPIYGKRVIAGERPFRATFANGVWTVLGTLQCAKGESCIGGVAVVEISRSDARILRVSHGK